MVLKMTLWKYLTATFIKIQRALQSARNIPYHLKHIFVLKVMDMNISNVKMWWNVIEYVFLKDYNLQTVLIFLYVEFFRC